MALSGESPGSTAVPSGSDRLAFGVLLVVLAAGPLAYDRAARDAYTAPKEAVFSIALCGIAALLGLARCRAGFSLNRGVVLGSLVLALAAASAVRSASWPIALDRLEELVLLGAPACFVGALLLRTPARILWFVEAIAVGAFLVAVIGILQHQLLDWWGYRPTLESARGGAPPPRPDVLAVPGVSAIVGPLYSWLHQMAQPSADLSWAGPFERLLRDVFQARPFARLATQDGPASVFGHPNVAAEVVASGAIGLAVAAVAAWRRSFADRKWVRVIAGALVRGAMLLVMGFYLIVTGTRGAWVGLLAAIVVIVFAWIAVAPRGARAKRAATASACVGALLIAGYFAAGFVTLAGRGGGAPERPLDRVLALFQPRDPSRDTILERRVLWSNTQAMIAEGAAAGPLDAAFGVGPGNWQVQYPLFHRRAMAHQPGTYTLRRYPDHPHQDALELLADGGLCGAGLVACLFAVVVSRLLRRMSGAGASGSAALALVAMTTTLATMSLFSFPFHMPVPLAIVFLAAGAALATGDPNGPAAALSGWTSHAGKTWVRVLVLGILFGAITALGGARAGALYSVVVGAGAALLCALGRRSIAACALTLVAAGLTAVVLHGLLREATGAFDAAVIVAASFLLALGSMPLDAPFCIGPTGARVCALAWSVLCVVAFLSGSSRIAGTEHLQSALDSAWGARYVPGERVAAEARARQSFDRATALDPAGFLGEVARADFLAVTSFLQDASMAAARVLAVHPWLINARVKLAEIRLAQGQDEVAMREARMARSLNGDAPEPHVLMGELFARQGRTELAVGAFERAIDLTPDRWNPRAKIRAAEVLFAAQSDLPRVLRHLGEAEREAESDADLVARIAAVYSARGAPPEFLAKGRSLWERVARLRPHDPAAKLRVTVAPLLDGEPTPEELGRILEFLEGVITAQPDFDPARVRYFRGLALERMGRREDALRAYREATLLMGVGGLRQPGGDAHLDAAIEAMRALQSETRPEETR